MMLTKYQSGSCVIVNRLILNTSNIPFALTLAFKYVEFTSIQQNPSIFINDIIVKPSHQVLIANYSNMTYLAFEILHIF